MNYSYFSENMPKIKLITIDIDGTLYPVKGKVMDPSHISEFQKAVRRLLSDEGAPIPIICTGKPAAYVEGFSEAYGLVDVIPQKIMSHICEAGSEIFVYNDWESKRYLRLPELFSKHDISDKLKHLESLVLSKIKCVKEEGKSTSLSFNPPEGMGVEELYHKIREVVGEHLGYSILGMEGADILSSTVKEIIALMKDGATIEDVKKFVVKKGYDFFITHSSTAVDISAFPTGKSLGIAYVAAMMHRVSFDEIVAIGDTAGDHPAFEIVKTSIGVANSSPATISFIRKRGGFITKRQSIEGVTDVLNYIYANRNTDSWNDKGGVFQ